MQPRPFADSWIILANIVIYRSFFLYAVAEIPEAEEKSKREIKR